MRLRNSCIGLAAAALVVAWSALSGGRTSAATLDPQAYFNKLIARADVWKAFSLRPVAGQPVGSAYYTNQLEHPKDGGYAAGNSTDLFITYQPATDTDPNKQDAAKVVIPAFSPTTNTGGLGTVSTAITASADPIVLVGAYGPLYNQNGRSVMIDSEIMDTYDPDGTGPLVPFDRNTGVLYVKRGQRGTAAASHAIGALARLSINTVPNAVRLPLGTQDGHTYFFTWDGLWTSSYLRSGLTNHKTFNFISDGIWLEPNTNFTGGTGSAKIPYFNADTDVAAYQHRSYNALGGPTVWDPAKENYLGPAATSYAPLGPQMSTFLMKPNRWIRFFVRLEQRANDYDYLDVWISDGVVGPVQVLQRMPVSVRKGSITEFVYEFNTSTDLYVRGNTRDLVAYVRNFVALKDPGDVLGLLERPVDPVPQSTGAPSPPTNLRIVPAS